MAALSLSCKSPSPQGDAALDGFENMLLEADTRGGHATGFALIDREGNKNHKILKFPILRASVKAYQNNLNTHKSYSNFRDKRMTMREKNRNIKGLELTETLKNYAQTGSEYTKILNQIIIQNRLTDFEPVRLVNSIKQIELSS